MDLGLHSGMTPVAENQMENDMETEASTKDKLCGRDIIFTLFSQGMKEQKRKRTLLCS